MMQQPDPLHVPLSELKGSLHQDEPRPSWRGWIHTGVLPFVVAAGILLIVFSEGVVAKSAAAIYSPVPYFSLATPLFTTASAGVLL